MFDSTMTAGGLPLPGSGAYDVVNPATGLVVARAPACGPAELDAAMAAAQAAFPAWSADEKARRAALHETADAIVAAVDRLAPLLTAEQGKPGYEARGEIAGACAWLRYYADLDLPAETLLQDDENGRIAVMRRPFGVVAAIAPWNFPVALALWKVAPALRAGNTVVLKPSPYTPLTTLAIGELLREVLPPGVLNVVSGPDPLGAWITAHRTPRRISFTGSTETGTKVMTAASADFKRISLELGGNDPAIVLDDADPAKIAEALFWGAFRNNGQFCMAVKRVYVPAALHGELVEALAARALATRVGDGAAEGTELGPVSNRRQYDRVAGLVADALGRGAVAAAGGAPAGDGPGLFFPPTILTGLSDGVPIVDEEQFGPALPVVAYDRLDDAIDRANGTPYGLTASVWSADTDRAAQVAARVDAGQVWINTHGRGALRPDVPFGGHKSSGIGLENGRWGLESFSEIQVVGRL
ncbi:aldehyde dehydrogenase family protein [Streptomyces sp. NRRL F-5123]|uniref:aldehyde dehydrogenase family protein n=1 Tax=Streptomyces sp. NRRL F-5123 TaxID=1463856 RepID=UPI000A436E29|nr:aldehyde dehydrogenase family protein [Streptomyces sp. NRRL F-5123]